MLQTPVRAYWTIKPEGVQLLREKFGVKFPNCFTHPVWRIPEPVFRHETQMVLQNSQFLVHVGPLMPFNNQCYIDWQGDRGWFDECVRIARQRGFQDGYRWWTGAEKSDITDHAYDDSYREPDHSLWANRQQERAPSLTLDSRMEVDLPGNIGKILEVSRFTRNLQRGMFSSRQSL